MKQNPISLTPKVRMNEGILIGLGTNTTVRSYCYDCGELMQIGRGTGYMLNRADGRVYLGPCKDCVERCRANAETIADLTKSCEDQRPEARTPYASGGSGPGPC